MNESRLTDLFNTREIAAGFWLGALLVFSLVKSEGVRRSLLEVVKRFFHPKILLIVGVMVAYTVGIVWALHASGLWGFDLLKDTVLWFVLAGAPVVFGYAGNGEYSVARLFRDQVRAVIIVEFLLNTYTLSLGWEFFLVPFVALLAGVDVLAKHQGQEDVQKAAGSVLALVGVAVLGAAIVSAWQEPQALVESLGGLLLPPALSVLFIPCAYVIILCMAYENLFMRFKMGKEPSRRVKRYAKLRLFRHIGLNVNRVNAFMRKHALALIAVQEKRDVDTLLTDAAEPNGVGE